MRAALALAVLLAACGSSSPPAPTCDQVIDHLMALGKSLEAEGMPAPSPDDRARMIQACDQSDPPEERTCELAAPDIDTYFSCHDKK